MFSCLLTVPGTSIPCCAPSIQTSWRGGPGPGCCSWLLLAMRRTAVEVRLHLAPLNEMAMQLALHKTRDGVQAADPSGQASSPSGTTATPSSRR